MNLEIRKATTEDAISIALLARITFREAFESIWDKDVLLDYFGKTFAVQKIRSSLAKENNVYWLAFVDELPVGYAKLKRHSPYPDLEDKSPAQLQKIYVLNDFIGNKVGKHLQDALFNEVAENKTETLWLAVWDGNGKAIRFYERYGFRKETKYQFDYDKMSFDFELMVKQFTYD